MYLISLYFDDVTNERIQSYMNQIAKRTGNDVMLAGNVPPHITLSAFEITQESEAVAVFEDLAKEFICGEIMWCSVGIFFPHTIYLLPVMNHYLFQMSEQAYQYISQIRQVKIHQRYQPFKNAPNPFGNIFSSSSNFLINGSFRKMKNNGKIIKQITYTTFTKSNRKNILITKPKIEI